MGNKRITQDIMTTSQTLVRMLNELQLIVIDVPSTLQRVQDMLGQQRAQDEVVAGILNAQSRRLDEMHTAMMEFKVIKFDVPPTSLDDVRTTLIKEGKIKKGKLKRRRKE